MKPLNAEETQDMVNSLIISVTIGGVICIIIFLAVFG